MNKKLENCQLADDAKSPSAYYEINRNKRRSDQYCPRCNAKRVNRPFRKCDNCQGALLWDGDDGAEYDRQFKHWFIWHKNLAGVAGWYNKDYWIGHFA